MTIMAIMANKTIFLKSIYAGGDEKLIVQQIVA